MKPRYSRSAFFQARYEALPDQLRTRFDTIVTATPEKLKEWNTKYGVVQGSVHGKGHSKILAMLLLRFVPGIIGTSCDICGSEFELVYEGRKVGFENFGFKRYCDHHTSKERLEATNRSKYGSAYPFQSRSVQKKVQKTFLKKYGGTSPMASKKVRDRVDTTNIERYGSIRPLGNSSVKARRDQTMIDRYGTEHALKNPGIMASMLDRLQSLYGVSNVMQDPDINAVQRNSIRNNHGVDHHFHIPEILEAQQRSAYRTKSYIDRNGNEIQLQGYEPLVCAVLESRGYYVARAEAPISYKDPHGRTRTYHPDLKVSTGRNGTPRIIEVKSLYTLMGSTETFALNVCKFKAAYSEFGDSFYLAVPHRDAIFMVQNPGRYSEHQLRDILSRKALPKGTWRLACQ